jgi:ribosomal protein L21E
MKEAKVYKFKVGDKVKVVKINSSKGLCDIDNCFVGKTGTITTKDYCSRWPYKVEFKEAAERYNELKNIYIFEEDELELYQEEKKEEQEVLKFGDLKIGEVYFCRSQSTYDGSVLDLDAKILSLDGFKDGKRFAVALSEDKEWCVKISEDQMKFVQKKKQIKWTNLYLKDSKNSIESGGLYNTEENAVRGISDKSSYLKTISIEI